MTVINSNISALKAQANIAANSRKLDSAMERLSTGTRINSAKDDAAGLAISNKMTAQINGLNQAIRNANDGLSMFATIEGSLTQTTNVLQRMRELAVQSSNDTNSVADRQFIQSEVVQMNAELDRISSQSRYNGQKVLDGSFSNKVLQIGANSNETISFNVSSSASSDIGIYETRQGTIGAIAGTAAGTLPANSNTAQTLHISGSLGTSTASIVVNSTAYAAAAAINNETSNTGVSATATTKAMISSLSDAGTITFDVTGKNSSAVTVSATVADTTDLTTVADAFNLVSSQTGITAQLSSDKSSVLLSNSDGYDIGLAGFTNSAVTNGGTVAVDGMTGNSTADSSITDTNYAPGTEVTLTSGNAADSTRVVGDLDFQSSTAFTVYSGSGAAGTDFVDSSSQSASLSAISDIDTSSQSTASEAISVIDGAIAKVSSMRGDLGAISSRLEKTVDSLTASSTNTSAARSRVLDADYSLETTNLSKAQIIAQASNAMLAQANQQPQMVLSLLK